MKKIILVLIIFIACYFIYNLTIDKKVSYLTLGDILSKGTNEYGVSNNGYSDYIRDYLKNKGIIKEYNNTFTSNDYRMLDIIKYFGELIMKNLAMKVNGSCRVSARWRML